MLKHFPLVALLLLLTACMTGAQVIKLQPEFSSSTANLANDVMPFAIQVFEGRDTNVLGVRSAEDEKATISTDEDSAEEVQTRLISAFEENGYPVDESAENRLLVSIEDMGYSVEADELIKKVNVNVEIKASVVSGEHSFTKQYKASHGKEVLKNPSDDLNQELVNKVFGVVIQRVLEDEELLSNLAN